VRHGLLIVLFAAAVTAAAPAETATDYGGVGISFRQMEPAGFVVQYAAGGSPAAAAGIKTRDRILCVDGRDVAGMTADAVANLLRGPVGTGVGLTIARGPSETLDVTLTRTTIVVPEQLYPARTTEGYAFIDRAGNTHIPPTFTFAGEFNEGVAVVSFGGRHGYLDRTGAMAVGTDFTAAYAFCGGFGRVESAGQTMFVRRDGRVAFRLKDHVQAGTRVWRFSEGRALAMVGQGKMTRYGFLDTTGAMVINPSFAWADDFSEGLAPARDVQTGKVGYIDRAGKWVISPQFQEGSAFGDGRAFVRTGEKPGFIDRACRMVFDTREWSCGTRFFEGRLAASQDDRYGYLDTLGEFVIKPQFDDAGPFSDGLAWVKVGDKCGYIDRTGRMVIPPQWQLDEVDNFRDGLVRIKPQGKWQYVDKSGKVVWREP